MLVVDTGDSLDEARAHLESLYAKQGRVNRFRSKAERDAFLSNELASLRVYQQTQTGALHEITSELESCRRSIAELAKRSEEVQARLEIRRDKVTELADELTKVKDKHGELVEKRKELWREDARLANTVGHAENELRSAERNLASMMDKDTGSGLRAIDRIKERYGLTGVYGPLYRLFEVTDKKFNTAVELTAGNRFVPCSVL